MSKAYEFGPSPAYPEVAVAVRTVLQSTMAAWQSAVRRALPSVDHLTSTQLRDDLPQILECVAETLQSPLDLATDALTEAAPRHGGVRYAQGFKLNEVFIEYSILRAVLVLEVAAQLGRDLASGEILALGQALDITLRRAVGRFVSHLTDQLQAATEAQSKYLSFLSHDLRGGLNGVFLMIEVLKRELAGETRLAETIADLDAMRRSLLETVATMDRFLYAERFRKGKIQVRPSPVNLRHLLAECVAHFSYQAKEKQVEIHQSLADLDVTSDRELLQMIFQNLVSNALKYTHARTAITIGGSSTDAVATITITDQGPGIAPEKLNELFAPFSRGETYGQPGVGLGLSIARQAAQYLNATLSARSRPGEGSTFIVELPRKISV